MPDIINDSNIDELIGKLLGVCSESSKLDVLKNIISTSNMQISALHASWLIRVFRLDDNRFEAAKLLGPCVVDPHKAYLMSDMFEFDTPPKQFMPADAKLIRLATDPVIDLENCPPHHLWGMKLVRLSDEPEVLRLEDSPPAVAVPVSDNGTRCRCGCGCIERVYAIATEYCRWCQQGACDCSPSAMGEE